MPGQVWVVPPGAAFGVEEPSGAVVPLGAGAVWVVLVVLDVDGVDEVAALAIAAPPAASEPAIARVAMAAAIRCRIGSLPFLGETRVNSPCVGGP
jgi:hypothetical protein